MLSGNFDLFEKEIASIQTHKTTIDCEKFALNEFLRFYSIAGSILENFKDVETNIDQRIFTHILLRSLLENYFWILYIFYDGSQSDWTTRFTPYLERFQNDYWKLYGEPNLPNKHTMEAPDPSWATRKPLLDINSVLAQLRNDHGNRLDYLYFLYRITSFDTHGRSLQSLFESSFGKTCNFPYLKIENAIDLIANEYLIIWNKIK